MGQPASNETEITLQANKVLFLQDKTSGKTRVRVGPCRVKVEPNHQFVIYDAEKDVYDVVTSDRAEMKMPFADERSYIAFQNPAQKGVDVHPKDDEEAAPLQVGRKVNVHGPAQFPLYPGQAAEVIPGHELGANHYLFVRVYNPDEAMANWQQAVMQRAEPDPKSEDQGDGADDAGGDDDGDGVETPKKAGAKHLDEKEPPKLKWGQLMVIKGSEVSFYMPPTGIEVVRDPKTKHFVREAVTLEQLEYCILTSDDDGSKEFVYGPSVVFPEATQSFVTRDGKRKFRAVELDPFTGIHIRVNADYTDEATGREYKRGEELFITGADQQIYMPRAEHSIISRGGRQLHRGVQIAPGRAYYLQDLLSGEITTVVGPKTILPDPRKQVFVTRVLSDDVVRLLYPNSTTAKAYNARLRDMTGGDTGRPLESAGLATRSRSRRGRLQQSRAEDALGSFEDVEETYIVTDDFERSGTPQEPFSVTLGDDKIGAVSSDVWKNYAMMIVDRSGKSRVAVGPETVHFAFDESPLPIRISAGTPKGTKPPIEDVFLKITHNYVSDRVVVETMDGVEVELTLSFRVNFEGETDEERELWFSVDDYVGLMTDQVRSILINTFSKVPVSKIRRGASDIVRDTILKKADPETHLRPGRKFENGMRIYEVNVVHRILNEDVAAQFAETEDEAVQQALQFERMGRQLADKQQQEEIQRQLDEVDAAANERRLQLELKQKRMLAELEEQRKELRLQEAALQAAEAEQKALLLLEQARKADEVEKLRQELELVKVARGTELVKAKGLAEKEQAEELTQVAATRKKLEAEIAQLEDDIKAQAEVAAVEHRRMLDVSKQQGLKDAQDIEITRLRERVEHDAAAKEKLEQLELELDTKRQQLAEAAAAAMHARRVEQINAERDADVQRTEADGERFAKIAPQFTTALQALTEKETADAVAKAIGPVHFLFGRYASLPDMMGDAFKAGSGRIGEIFKAMSSRRSGNGAPEVTPPSGLPPSPSRRRQPAPSSDSGEDR